MSKSKKIGVHIHTDEFVCMKTLDGHLHCDDGPSFVSKQQGSLEATTQWHQHGVQHRSDGPAVIVGDLSNPSYQEWIHHNKSHRVDGPARLWANGKAEWLLNGETHRDHGPAIYGPGGENDDSYFRAWYTHGICTKTSGPEPDPVLNHAWHHRVARDKLFLRTTGRYSWCENFEDLPSDFRGPVKVDPNWSQE